LKPIALQAVGPTVCDISKNVSVGSRSRLEAKIEGLVLNKLSNVSVSKEKVSFSSLLYSQFSKITYTEHCAVKSVVTDGTGKW